MLKDYFSFSKKERTGVVLLVLIIITVTLLPVFFKSRTTADPKQEAAFRRMLAKMRTAKHDSIQQRKEAPSEPPAAQYFLFDPNTLPASGWRKLGMPDRTIRTIMNFRHKGGRFYEPADIRNIYGLPAATATRLIPYIRIVQPRQVDTQEHAIPDVPPPFVKRTYTVPFTDINTADTTALKRLPGIGPVLAARIVHFREKLGGFYRVEQLEEVYHLPDSVYQHLLPHLQCTGPVTKLDINEADAQQLQQHPYISPQLAAIIVQYRVQHGNYQSIAGLKQIMVVSDSLYRRVAPYLSTGLELQ